MGDEPLLQDFGLLWVEVLFLDSTFLTSSHVLAGVAAVRILMMALTDLSPFGSLMLVFWGIDGDHPLSKHALRSTQVVD